MSSKTSQPPSSHLPDPSGEPSQDDKCPRCGSLLVLETVEGETVTRCIMCARYYWHDRTEVKKQQDTAQRSYSSARPKTARLPVAVQPPAPPRKESEWDIYAAECSTYATYLWFTQQEQVHGRVAQDQTHSKGDRWRANNRAKLCRDLANVLAQLRAYWTKNVVQKFMKDQKRLGRVPSIDNRLKQLNGEYNDLMLLAASWVPEDPPVQIWLDSRQRLGQRDYLRKARQGHEKGVKRPYSLNELELDCEIMALDLEGYSLRAIRNSLDARGLFPDGKKLTHVAIRNRIRAFYKDIGLPSPSL